jgi:hypothetical protein
MAVRRGVHGLAVARRVLRRARSASCSSCRPDCPCSPGLRLLVWEPRSLRPGI